VELRTYTSLWQVERRLYRIDDFTLPGAPTYKQIGIFVGFTVPWVVLMSVLHVPFSPPWNAIWVIPPFAITWAANKPLVESKTLWQLGYSQLRFLLQSRRYARLARYEQPDLIDTGALIWNRGSTPARELPVPEMQTGGTGHRAENKKEAPIAAA
jgi:hypothetical protein